MKKIFLLIASLGLFASSAFAESATHDGFFLRLAPGFGQTETKSSGVTFEDTNIFFSLMLGGAVQENTILHVEMAGTTMENPSVSEGGSLDGNLTTSLLGIGMTQYYMPTNAYVSLSIGLAKSTLEIDGVDYDSDNGLGANFMIGKEWWVSDDWGLGLAGHLFYAKCSGGFNDKDIKTLAYGLLFSATYN